MHDIRRFVVLVPFSTAYSSRSRFFQLIRSPNVVEDEDCEDDDSRGEPDEAEWARSFVCGAL